MNFDLTRVGVAERADGGVYVTVDGVRRFLPWAEDPDEEAIDAALMTILMEPQARPIVEELVEEVREFRERMGERFLTPDPMTSILFALTEVGEAIDARLREDPRWKRNREKDHDFPRELAQALLMTLTAMMGVVEEEKQAEKGFSQREILFLGEVLYRLAQAMFYPSQMHTRAGMASDMLTIVMQAYGIDPMEAVRREMARIERKFGGEDK